MNHHPAAWGQPLPAGQSSFEAYYPHLAPKAVQKAVPISHTQQPLVTGTSVLGLKFDGGVMLAADNLASYGSLARFKDIQRLHALGSHTVLAASGDMSDFQYVKKELGALLREEEALSLTDSHPSFSPDQIYTFLGNWFYARRSKMNPLWNAMIVGGWDKNKKEPFIGYVDLQGTTYTAPTLASGFGAHIAQPLLREAFEKTAGIDHQGPMMSQEEAEKVMDDCMRVLFYRDARSLNKYQIATITADGVKISESRSAPTEWNFAEGLRGYGAQIQ